MTAGVIAPFSSQVLFSGDISSPATGPNVLTITQQEYAHDIATMNWWAADVDSSALESGQPLTVTWGRPTYKRIFYGYVNHRSRVNNALSTVQSLSDRSSINITTAGASWPLKQAGTKVWFSVTADQVVQEVAAQFGLSADTTPHPFVWDNLQMAGQSYWQFLVCLAQRIGYTFYANGPQLVFKPRQTNPADIQSLAAIYDYKGNPAGLPIFTPVLGANSPSGGQLANRQLAGIDHRTNQPIFSYVSGDPSPTILGQTAQDPIFAKIHHDTVITQGESDAKLNGTGLLNQLYLTSTASANGNPMIAQGSLVYVINANGSQNGLWFVQKAVHTLNNKNYTLDLQLGRDSIGATAVINSPPQTQTGPFANLISNTWVAA